MGMGLEREGAGEGEVGPSRYLHIVVLLAMAYMARKGWGGRATFILSQ